MTYTKDKTHEEAHNDNAEGLRDDNGLEESKCDFREPKNTPNPSNSQSVENREDTRDEDDEECNGPGDPEESPRKIIPFLSHR